MLPTQGKTPDHGAVNGAKSGADRAAPYPPALKPGGYGASRPNGRAGSPDYGAQNGAFVPTKEYLTVRLEEAGRALIALPHSGYSPRLRQSNLELVRSAIEAYGWAERRIRPPIPTPEAIDAMDEAYAWLALIPQEKYVIRRLVAARSLVHPLTDRHLYPWRRLGDAIGADHKAVQRWWAQGIDIILGALARN